MSRLLDDNERRHFVQWLREDIVSSEALIRQMDDKPYLLELIKQFRLEILSANIIVNKLENVESQTIGNVVNVR